MGENRVPELEPRAPDRQPGSHWKPSRKFDPQDDQIKRGSVKNMDVVHIFRSSFDRDYFGYNQAAASCSRRKTAWQQLTDCLDEGKLLSSTRVSPKLLQDLFQAVDGYFFRGTLGPYSKIEQTDLGKGCFGVTYTPKNSKGKVKSALIQVNTVGFEGKRPYDQFLFMVGTIMHECCHAALGLYGCRCRACRKNWYKEVGEMGHGTAWVKLATAVVQRARKSSRMKGTGGDHVEYHRYRDTSEISLLGLFDRFGRGLQRAIGEPGASGSENISTSVDLRHNDPWRLSTKGCRLKGH